MKVDRIQEQLKIVLRVFYDIQKERVSMANRIDSLIFLSECERDESGRPIIKKRPRLKRKRKAVRRSFSMQWVTFMLHIRKPIIRMEP